MPTVYAEVYVDFDDFSSEDLIKELRKREALPNELADSVKELLEAIWLKRRVGNTNYQKELDELIYQVLGKIV